MEIMNSMEKMSHVEACSDYSNAFKDVLVSKCRGYDEVNLIFDRYHDKSLKTKMRSKRTQCTLHTYYHVSDSTIIKHISLKDFLSDVRTKAELCECLARKVLNYSWNPQRKLGNFMVTYNTVTEGNMFVLPNLRAHNHEEADTVLLLHASCLDSSSYIVVQLPDTDVLVLLVSLYVKLAPNIWFSTGKGDKK